MHCAPCGGAPEPCISIIGMAGAGKSTVGQALAQSLDWAFMDSDYLMESLYASRLQGVTDELSKEAFLDLEACVVGSVRAPRTVLATGGSVIYREAAMRHLAAQGPVVHLEVSFEVIEERIARNPERGLAIAPGQTLRGLFEEREVLYRRYAGLHCPAAGRTPQQCAEWIRDRLQEQGCIAPGTCGDR
ncbi:homoserine kinase [uncultured Desulfovibrio sp.]|uniref:homoserine kinase n=1 Tax=uncultured Desulfovibrio sp. TaxID=167968 RepID=UPI00262DE941|nr:homoserine kinase [uncultured Desulfovibrio sp.]